MRDGPVPQDLKHVQVLPAARARDIDSEPDLVGQAQRNVKEKTNPNSYGSIAATCREDGHE